MDRIVRFLGVGPVVLGICLLLPSCSADNRQSSLGPAIDDRNQLTVERVAELVQESGGDFVAGVQEVVDDSQCYGAADGSSCPLTVRIVDFIAGEPGRPRDRCAGWTYSTMEMRMEKPWPNRKIGRKRLVLAYPTKKPGLYGNRLFILDPTEEDVDKLREVFDTLQAGGVGRSSNLRLNPSVGPVTGLAKIARPAPVPPAG